MPLYEYQCEKCGHRFEKIQKFSDKMVKKCPSAEAKLSR
jgi:putative FmdB family regulatory protein